MSEKKIAIIGDIHGCYYTLKSLYCKITETDEVYSVGDLIDRGKYSKEVVQFCMDNNIKPVKGNHEDMMIKAIEKSDKFFSFIFKDAELYYYNGGRETQYSYISSRLYSNFKKFKEEIRSLGHFDFLNNLPLKYEIGNVVISHAGIVDGGNDVSILWNRNTPAYLDKLQVFGHTPLEEVDFKKKHYVNIDTGCVYQNKLTAVIIDKHEGIIEKTIQEDCNTQDIE